MITKWCFCCSLKYGVFTYGLISLSLRFCISMLWYINLASSEAEKDKYMYIMKIYTSPFVTWNILTCFTLFLSLKGIIQRKALLLFPHIIIQILELIFMNIYALWITISIKVWFPIVIPIIHSITSIYFLICLICLFKQIKKFEKRSSYVTLPNRTV